MFLARATQAVKFLSPFFMSVCIAERELAKSVGYPLARVRFPMVRNARMQCPSRVRLELCWCVMSHKRVLSVRYRRTTKKVESPF